LQTSLQQVETHVDLGVSEKRGQIMPPSFVDVDGSFLGC
jgi:hypothetical protein